MGCQRLMNDQRVNINHTRFFNTFMNPINKHKKLNKINEGSRDGSTKKASRDKVYVTSLPLFKYLIILLLFVSRLTAS